MNKINYSQEFYRKEFVCDNFKSAYLKAAKWVASNVIANSNLNDVLFYYEKKMNEEFPSIIVRLYVFIDEKELRNRQCASCKEMHNSFFVNKAADCSRCESAAYQRRADEYISHKKSYYRELIEKAETENDL